MNFKKLRLALPLIAGFTYTQADVIELDNQDPQICKQQLLAAKSIQEWLKFPIIVDYSPTCGACRTYLPIFEAASNNKKYKDIYLF